MLARHADFVKARLARVGASNVRVFGSISRQEDSPESDADLLIDVADHTSAFALVLAQLDIEEKLGCKVDLVTARSVPPRKQNIIVTAIPL